jgi:hypothetical protein
VPILVKDQVDGVGCGHSGDIVLAHVEAEQKKGREDADHSGRHLILPVAPTMNRIVEVAQLDRIRIGWKLIKHRAEP